jgi:alpha-tubulin suppressor-like RCC1 family protein
MELIRLLLLSFTIALAAAASLSSCVQSQVLAVQQHNSHTLCVVTPGSSVACASLTEIVDVYDTPNAYSVVVTTPNFNTTSPVISIAGGDYHMCALLFDGTVYCWGDSNTYG